MEIAPAVQWFGFGLFALLAVAGAIGMTTTMSMFRSGIFLMASFIGVAGLFLLLLADLLALLQVMMYIGGMLVMILFMLLFSNDPGGMMMSSHMDLKGFEKFFSLGLAHISGGDDDGKREHDDGGEEESDEHQHGGGDGQDDDEQEEHQHDGDGDHERGGGGHSDMSMFTPAKAAAAVLATTVGLMLIGFLLWRPAWLVTGLLPDQDSSRRIGELLMNKYMIAFEGAGLMILLGIFGAVQVQRPSRHPDAAARDDLHAAVDEPPVEVELDVLRPLGEPFGPLPEHDEEDEP